MRVEVLGFVASIFRDLLGSRRLLVSVIPFVICYFSYWIFNSRYVGGDFLIQDDNIHVSNAFFGWAVGDPSNFLLYDLLGVLSGVQTVTGLRLLFLAIFSLSASLAAMIFSRIVPGIVAPVLLGVLVSSLPVAADQTLFITASHPSLALFFLLFAVLVFEWGREASGGTSILLYLVALVGLFCAAFSSPLALIAPLALPLWMLTSRLLLVGSVATRREWMVALVVVIVAEILVYSFTGLLSHHYSGIVGWTDISAARVLSNLGISVGRVILLYGRFDSVMFWMFAGGLLAVLAVVFSLRRRQGVEDSELLRRSRRTLVLGINSLLLAGLTFGPASIVTYLSERYLVVSMPLAVLSGLVFIIALSRFFEPPSQWQKQALLLVVAVLVGMNIWRTHQIVDERYAPQLAVHEAVSELVKTASSRWPKNAQVVMLTADGYQAPTNGYNHWSSWYMRYMTKNTKILALLGDPAAGRFPFVDEYRDSGPEYWEVIDGRSQHVRMVGLEVRRPLFVYRQGLNGEFSAVKNVLFTDGDGMRLVSEGSSYAEGVAYATTNAGGAMLPADYFLWPSTRRAVP